MSMVLLTVVPTVLIALLCAAIIRKIQTQHLVGLGNSVKKRIRRDKAIKMLLFIILAYYLLTAPVAILYMISLFAPQRLSSGCLSTMSAEMALLFQVADIMSRLSAVSSPINLCYFNRTFRKELIELFRKRQLNDGIRLYSSRTVSRQSSDPKERVKIFPVGRHLVAVTE
ncbi:hypothetical protein HDE_05838 [Halotydeus destructor]|nr:hypothetical protein HDE_05838 [Halotydeus destructor]